MRRLAVASRRTRGHSQAMCGRFGLSRPDKLKLERFGIVGLPEGIRPRFNIAPGTPALVVRERKGERDAGMLRWGLVPWWAQSPAVGARMANARADNAFTKPAFRDSMRLRRCLIPADVFYEWQAVPGSRRKQPWAIGLGSGEPFALGGLWDFWRPKDGGEGLATFAILTTAPNALLAPIHDRMPVIIPADRYLTWLDPRTPDPGVAEFVRAFPSELMKAWTISPRVNKADEDDAGLLEPASPPVTQNEQLELG
ncbi:MAG: SOS response-associated peptidase [Gemmatimonadaceae bacterium]|nr:SOS response-associated peptidase [Gemmatimonadaceae bacterium]